MRTPAMKRPGIREVALRAGVSRAAVSKVIRDAYGTSAEMRRKVEAAMKELDYHPSSAARGLRGRTYTLGVLIPDIRNWFFPDILDGVIKQLEGTRYQPLVGIGETEVDNQHELVETMLGRRMDGIILISPHLDLEYIQRVAHSIPTVFIGRHQSGMGFDTVNNDDERGGRMVVEHLASLGHERIAHFVQSNYPRGGDHSTSYKRLVGYQGAMRELGLEEHVQLHLAARQPEVYAATLSMLQRRDRPTAVFAWTDNVAFAAMSATEEMGLRIPADLSLVGYDNSGICSMNRISMTSIDQSAHLLGEMAARLLIERIDGRREEVHFVTPPRLVIRGSTRALRSR